MSAESTAKPVITSEAWLQPDHGPRHLLEMICNLGRATENHVVINSRKASRLHATVHALDAMEFWLVDHSSANGTYHNGRRILRPTPLADGDRILIADTPFIFRQILALPPGDTPPDSGDKTIVEFRERPAWLLIADLADFAGRTQHGDLGKLAVAVNDWINGCQRVVEEHGGQLGKHLGDGFLAYWAGEAIAPAQFAAALEALRTYRESSGERFRTACHFGKVTFGGPTALGEERMIGGDLNFIFRLERLASALGIGCCLSASAHHLLGSHVTAEPLTEEHELKGFPGRHRLFRGAWPENSSDS